MPFPLVIVKLNLSSIKKKVCFKFFAKYLFIFKKYIFFRKRVSPTLFSLFKHKHNRKSLLENIGDSSEEDFGFSILLLTAWWALWFKSKSVLFTKWPCLKAQAQIHGQISMPGPSPGGIRAQYHWVNYLK